MLYTLEDIYNEALRHQSEVDVLILGFIQRYKEDHAEVDEEALEDFLNIHINSSAGYGDLERAIQNHHKRKRV